MNGILESADHFQWPSKFALTDSQNACVFQWNVELNEKIGLNPALIKPLNQRSEVLTLPLGFQQHVYWKMMSRKRRRVIILGMWIFTTSLIICEVYFSEKARLDSSRLISPASWWIPLNILQFSTILLKKVGSSASSWHSWGLEIDLRRRFLLKLVEKIIGSDEVVNWGQFFKTTQAFKRTGHFFILLIDNDKK